MATVRLQVLSTTGALWSGLSEALRAGLVSAGIDGGCPGSTWGRPRGRAAGRSQFGVRAGCACYGPRDGGHPLARTFAPNREGCLISAIRPCIHTEFGVAMPVLGIPLARTTCGPEFIGRCSYCHGTGGTGHAQQVVGRALHICLQFGSPIVALLPGSCST